jgi:hypothetical protein
MEQNTLKKNMWNAAGTAGLALGAVSAAYLFAGQFIAGDIDAPASFWQQAIAIVLWVTKFIGCIWLMNFFMKKFLRENEGIDQKTLFRMGMLTALLSALMFSAIYLANMLYISADYYDQIFQTAIRQMASSLDSNSLSELRKIMDKLPQITFIYYLTYCFLFGTVLSAILSRNILPKNPFAVNRPDEQ